MMRERADFAIRYWPLWTLAVVLISIAYVAGIFHEPGLELLTYLQFGDYISLSLPALPYTLFLIVANLLLSDDPELKRLDQEEWSRNHQKVEMDKPPEQRAFRKFERRHKKYGILGLLTPLAITSYWVASNALPPTMAWVSFVYLVIAMAVLLLGLLVISPKVDFDIWRLCLLAFFALGATYSTGLLVGSENYTKPADTLFVLDNDRSVCANVVTHSREGAIVVASGATTVFSRQIVREFKHQSPCSVGSNV